jgi:ribosomal protein L31
MNHTTNATTPIQTTVTNPCTTVSATAITAAHPAYTGNVSIVGTTAAASGYPNGYVSGHEHFHIGSAKSEFSDPYVRLNVDNTVTIDKLKLGPDAELLTKRLERIEAALGIATRLPALENTYVELHEAGENMDYVITHARHINEVIGAGSAYITLTTECEIMEKLKSNNDPEE